jgi:preprotein translocase subunit SecA
VEGRNFDIRKHILEYDDVLNQHRLVLYRRRNKILENAEILENALQLIREDIASRLM